MTSFTNPIARLNNGIACLFGSNVASDVFVPAICEEIEFRWGVQELLLRQAPKKFLEYVAPKYANLVDSTPARINRIVLTALLFAYCHVEVLDCSNGGGINELLGGLLYGTIYEYTDYSLATCMNLHCIFNLMVEMNQS